MIGMINVSHKADMDIVIASGAIFILTLSTLIVRYGSYKMPLDTGLEELKDHARGRSLAKRPRMVESGKIGVLLINLGSPEGTDFWSVRRYLKEFLGDRRVVEIPRPIWWLILNGIILNTRPQKSGKKYEEVWDKENDLAPLISITKDTSEKLAQHLSSDEQAHRRLGHALWQTKHRVAT